ncbi:MAG TPA: hypothetical protein VKX28_03835 [Xanthobacteraceae bacterium]|nr:hypothetical protein [Xanthobacteraceae bacterium]
MSQRSVIHVSLALALALGAGLQAASADTRGPCWVCTFRAQPQLPPPHDEPPRPAPCQKWVNICIAPAPQISSRIPPHPPGPPHVPWYGSKFR